MILYPFGQLKIESTAATPGITLAEIYITAYTDSAESYSSPIAVLTIHPAEIEVDENGNVIISGSDSEDLISSLTTDEIIELLEDTSMDPDEWDELYDELNQRQEDEANGISELDYSDFAGGYVPEDEEEGLVIDGLAD